jgi:hypothetical protein
MASEVTIEGYTLRSASWTTYRRRMLLPTRYFTSNSFDYEAVVLGKNDKMETEIDTSFKKSLSDERK